MRLVAQGLVDRPYAAPAQAVAALGAMQGQDLPGVIASAALRSRDSGVAAVLADMDEGRIVRSYPMRGTVFLVPASEAAWLGQLCAVPALRSAASRMSRLSLTDRHVDEARDMALAALSAAPRGLNRKELFAVWEDAGQSTDGGIGYHLLARFISETLLCYGPWNGVDQNVVSAATWLPADSGLENRFNGDRVAAVTVLLRQYLASRGPATIRDFAWWTKLPLTEIRAALPAASAELETDGESYWRPGLRELAESLRSELRKPLLLPGFDEFILGYQDRTFAMTADHHELLVPGNNGVFQRCVVIDGIAKGLWKRAGRPGRRTLEVTPFGTISARNRATMERLFPAFPWVTD